LRKSFAAGFCDQIILFQSDTGLQFLAVESGFDCDYVTGLKCVVPVGIDVRVFVSVETYAVA
jgi:hypothetical protein